MKYKLEVLTKEDSQSVNAVFEAETREEAERIAQDIAQAGGITSYILKEMSDQPSKQLLQE